MDLLVYLLLLAVLVFAARGGRPKHKPTDVEIVAERERQDKLRAMRALRATNRAYEHDHPFWWN